MYTIEYLPIARRDMVDIAKYIGVKLANPDAAERLAEKMAESAEDLANMPYKCPMYIPVKPLKHEYRKLIVNREKIGDKVEIKIDPENPTAIEDQSLLRMLCIVSSVFFLISAFLAVKSFKSRGKG